MMISGPIWMPPNMKYGFWWTQVCGDTRERGHICEEYALSGMNDAGEDVKSLLSGSIYGVYTVLSRFYLLLSMTLEWGRGEGGRKVSHLPFK